MKKYYKYSLIIVLLMAAGFRLSGLNWDQNQHLHPDERFLTMVANDISWPNSISEYLGYNNPLSPYNNNYDFFVYGTFPVYLVKFASEFITLDAYDYNNVTLVGRLLSAIMEVGVVIIIYKLSELLINKKTGLLAAFIYSVYVLPIQLSHFFTTDTFSVFFLLLSFYLLTSSLKTKYKHLHFPLAGISLGIGLASKISSLYFIPLLMSVFLYLFIKKRYKSLMIGTLSFTTGAYSAWRVFDPKTFVPDSFFQLNPQFVDNIKQLQSFNKPDAWFPPAVQWIKTTPIVFPLNNIILWGIGIPLSFLVIFSMLYVLIKNTKYLYGVIKSKGIKAIVNIEKEPYFMTIIVIWIIGYFLYQSTQFVKTMRYFYVLYPFFALISALTLTRGLSRLKSYKNYALIILLVSSIIYPLSFVTIYFRDHTRIKASEWIYKNVPTGSIITCEHWDDCLPLSVDNKNPNIYTTIMLEMYNPDSYQKWTKLNNQLDEADYLILSSNRLWGSIPTVPERYPESSEFYLKLLNGELKFKKVAEFTSRPTIPLLGLEIDDDNAEEAFTVYDHPKVMIFKKEKS